MNDIKNKQAFAFEPDVRRGLLWAMLTALMWGLLSIGLKVASHTLDSFTMVWFRFVMAFVLLTLYYAVRKPSALQALIKQPLLSFFAALGLAGNYFFYMKGVELMSPSNAQLFIQAGPLLLVILGVVFFKERLSVLQMLGLCVSACGFALFFWDQLQAFLLEADLYRHGAMWIMVASLCWASFAVFQKILMMRGANPQELNYFIYGFSTFLFFPMAHVEQIVAIPLSMWPVMIFLSLNTLVAYGGLAEAFKNAPASTVSIVITTNPVITLLVMSILSFFEVSWIKPERVHLQGYLGAAAVICGACLVAQKKKKS